MAENSRKAQLVYTRLRIETITVTTRRLKYKSRIYLDIDFRG
jgi:hypothetical protein